jgi:hypothetical protein
MPTSPHRYTCLRTRRLVRTKCVHHSAHLSAQTSQGASNCAANKALSGTAGETHSPSHGGNRGRMPVPHRSESEEGLLLIEDVIFGAERRVAGHPRPEPASSWTFAFRASCFDQPPATSSSTNLRLISPTSTASWRAPPRHPGSHSGRRGCASGPDGWPAADPVRREPRSGAPRTRPRPRRDAVKRGHAVGMQPRPQAIVGAAETLVRVVESPGQLLVPRESQLELSG